ncbi:MAG TPA: hypothetical protein VE224_04690 [Pseudolabrys sp.]|nr:hypothetical protein [Pseudolabrys sp.]
MYLAHVVLGLNYSATRLLQHLEGVCLQLAEGAPHQPPVRQ